MYGNALGNFIKYQFDSRTTSKVIEKTSIRWVNMDTIINCIENRTPPISLRGVFLKTIQNCKESLMFLQN